MTYTTPEFAPQRGLDFRGPGRVAYQAVLNKSLPIDRTGSVSFQFLRTDHPVTGTYSLKSADGRTWNGSFTATRGNTPFPIC